MHHRIHRVALLAGCLVSAAISAWTAPLKEVVVVFKTHFDIGYTDLEKNVLAMYNGPMMDKALAVCDASAGLPPEEQFVWTLPGWPMWEILGAQPPERRERIMDALRKGRFVTHALPFTTHTESLDLEDLVRGLEFSTNIAREAGIPLPRDAKMTDVPCHSWILPTLLAHAGIEFLHIGCNAASSSPKVPAYFQWMGVDGSYVNTYYSASGYGSDLIPPPDWTCEKWLAVIHTGDNQGPPTADAIAHLLKQAKRELPGVNIHLGRLSDFSDPRKLSFEESVRLMASSTALMETGCGAGLLRGDMPDTWIHGIMAMPIESGVARITRPRIFALEALHTLMGMWGAAAPGPVDEVVAHAYERSLRYGEHTFGMDAKKFDVFHYGPEWTEKRAKGEYATLEESWREKGGAILEAAKAIGAPLAAHLDALAAATAVEGKRWTVYNPLTWTRSGMVEIAASTVPAALRDLRDGATIPVEPSGDGFRFAAKDVPSLGYTTFVPTDAMPATPENLHADAGVGTLENAWFRIQADAARGAIVSFVDKTSGRELAGGDEWGFGQYLHERFDKSQVEAYVKAYSKIDASWAYDDFGKPNLPPADQVPYSARTAQRADASATVTPVSASLEWRFSPTPELPHDVTVRYTLYTDLPVLDVAWTIAGKPAEVWPEAGWLCFPCTIAEPRFQAYRLGGVVDFTQDILKGANHDVTCLYGGAALLGADNAGIGLCPLDSPLVSFDRPGLWKYSPDFTPTHPNVYVNLYNNQWSTNFQLWSEGTWTSRVRLWAIPAYSAGASLTEPSLEARYPLLAGSSDGAPGTLPPSQPGVALDRPGVLATALTQRDEGVLLRLWEQACDNAPVTVHFPKKVSFTEAKPCDLRGTSNGDALPIEDGTLRVPIKAYAPASFYLK